MDGRNNTLGPGNDFESSESESLEDEGVLESEVDECEAELEDSVEDSLLLTESLRCFCDIVTSTNPGEPLACLSFLSQTHFRRLSCVSACQVQPVLEH